MLFTALALALAAQAATPAPQTSDDIVVTGERLTRETARRYVNDISRPVADQLPTFRNPVCPLVIGMPEDHAAVVVARVRKVAKHVGIDVAKPGCAANFRIIVVDDSQAFVSQLKEQKPMFFAGMENSEVKRLLADTRPALAWSSTQTQNEDGYTYAANASGQSAFGRGHKNRVSAGGPGNSEDASHAADNPTPQGGGNMQRNMSASIIKSSTQQAILDSYVVIDTKAASGKSLMQVAEYATMRAMAAAQPPQEGTGVETILSLFEEGRESPPSMRAPDVAYLKALYSASPTMNKMQQLNRLSKAVLETSPKDSSAGQ